MHKNAVGTFLKGMGSGVVASCVAGASVYVMSGGKNKTKKKISSAVKTAAEFMDNMSYMLKQRKRKSPVISQEIFVVIQKI